MIISKVQLTLLLVIPVGVGPAMQRLKCHVGTHVLTRGLRHVVVRSESGSSTGRVCCTKVVRPCVIYKQKLRRQINVRRSAGGSKFK